MMRITVYGQGKVGGGLADLWMRAAHQVKLLGRGGDNAADADMILLAVPGGAITERRPAASHPSNPRLMPI
jgi:predicted dinucleotide-binding enzyme